MTTPASGPRHPNRRSPIRLVILIAASFILLALTPRQTTGRGWPTSPAAKRFRFPAGWLNHSGVWCLHNRESTDWFLVNPPYSGGLQMLDSTFQSVGGRGKAGWWSVREQVFRAFLVWQRDGGSFREWSTAAACGVR